MAQGRFVNKSIAEDDRLGKLSAMAEFVFLKTIPHLDRDGMITGKPGLLYSKTHPLREELFGQTQTFIDEWVAVGLVIPFNTPEGPALFFPGFAKNNKLPHYDREQPSRFPPPPGWARGETGLYPAHRQPPIKTPRKPKGSAPEVLDEVQELVLDEVLDEVQELVHDEVDEVMDEVPVLGAEVEVEVRDQDQQKKKGESNSDGAEAPAPPLPSSDSKDHPAIKAYHELHKRYPNRAQMALVIEHDPEIGAWGRAIRAWALAGHNPTNFQGMLDWALEPGRIAAASRGGGYTAARAPKTGYGAYNHLLDELPGEAAP